MVSARVQHVIRDNATVVYVGRFRSLSIDRSSPTASEYYMHNIKVVEVTIARVASMSMKVPVRPMPALQ